MGRHETRHHRQLPSAAARSTSKGGSDDGVVAVDVDKTECLSSIDIECAGCKPVDEGGADIASRPQERERLEATFPDHKTVIVEGAGTYVESDAPEEFVAAILEWLPATSVQD
ncbi:hypothetical protein [Rhodococcus sp. KRD162]|uniref:alpha/beta fold hydrolase n=1 Tax=Rhodococcus sp. KRD162 TaxID=2729725 RepID=UPI001F49A420|nr:hypothetical protein [Rhodococcus sp. KRD162]